MVCTVFHAPLLALINQAEDQKIEDLMIDVEHFVYYNQSVTIRQFNPGPFSIP
jgi:hypothetical protein